jgi:L-seryl-tRNA(Ser) seleniumtransferase
MEPDEPQRVALAALPRVDDLVRAADPLVRRYGPGPTTGALRAALDRVRRGIREGRQTVSSTAIIDAAAADLSRRFPGPPSRVVNATGVVIHTNLGRAPLSRSAVEAMTAAAGYCDVEYEVETGSRGSRGSRLAALLAEVTGAEAGIAVNNAAGALVLALAALASGRQVPVARGELVEIGGSFRLPEIMAASGARLLEVGTTNRTRAADYRAGDDVALVLKVHPSNYRVTGFTEAPSLAELSAVARDRGVPLLYDVGSGLLADRQDPWLREEPSVSGALAAGADLVICSGDKLIGGPQAGLLVGRRALVDACQRHPLTRALRLDKLRIAALSVTLADHLRGDLPPVWRMLQADPDELGRRAAALASSCGGIVVDGVSLIGGGSAPGTELPGPVVQLACDEPDLVARRLRAGDPPVVVRVEGGAVWVDPRTVAETDDALLAGRLAAALR